jgi:hypothetical protein
MPCLFFIFILAFPRAVLVLMFFFSNYLQRAYHGLLPGGALGDLAIPVIGFFFLPLTTIVYAWLMNSHRGTGGINLIFLIVAVLIDLGGLSGGERYRRTTR